MNWNYILHNHNDRALHVYDYLLSHTIKQDVEASAIRTAAKDKGVGKEYYLVAATMVPAVVLFDVVHMVFYWLHNTAHSHSTLHMHRKKMNENE